MFAHIDGDKGDDGAMDLSVNHLNKITGEGEPPRTTSRRSAIDSQPCRYASHASSRPEGEPVTFAQSARPMRPGFCNMMKLNKTQDREKKKLQNVSD